MEFNIGKLKSELGGIARPYLFQVQFGPTPKLLSLVFGGASSSEFSSYMVRSASIPAKTVGSVPIPFYGIDLKLAGAPSYGDTWKCTFLVDGAYKIRNIMERWSNQIHSVSNLGNQTYSSPSDYMGNVFIDQLDESKNVLARYTLHFAWPSTIGEITLAHSSKDQLETFDVDFTYSFWTRPEAQLKI